MGNVAEKLPTSVDAKVLEYLKATQIDVLGGLWTKILMVALLLAGSLLVGIAVISWGMAESLSAASSSITTVMTTGVEGSENSVTCSGSLSSVSEDSMPGSISAQLPSPCPTPPSVQGLKTDGETSSSTGSADPTPAPAPASTPTPETATPTPSDAASSQATPAAATDAMPGSVEGAPTTVSKRSASFYLYLMLLGGGVLLVGSFLPRIQSIKLAGLEVAFGQSPIPPDLYLKILSAISKSSKPATDKQAAVDKLAALAQPVIGVRALGKHPRPSLTPARRRTVTDSEVEFVATPAGQGFIHLHPTSATMSDEDVQQVADLLLGSE